MIDNVILLFRQVVQIALLLFLSYFMLLVGVLLIHQLVALVLDGRAVIFFNFVVLMIKVVILLLRLRNALLFAHHSLKAQP